MTNGVFASKEREEQQHSIQVSLWKKSLEMVNEICLQLFSEEIFSHNLCKLHFMPLYFHILLKATKMNMTLLRLPRKHLHK